MDARFFQSLLIFSPISGAVPPDRIKALDNRSQITMASLVLQIERMARSSPCQSWVDYTTITAEVLELLHVNDRADGCVMWSAPQQGAGIPSFLFACTEKDNNREGMALPCENPEGNNVQHIRMMTLYSHERYSHEEVEEVIEEIKPSLFSADASSSQHRVQSGQTLLVLCDCASTTVIPSEIATCSMEKPGRSGKSGEVICDEILILEKK